MTNLVGDYRYFVYRDQDSLGCLTTIRDIVAFVRYNDMTISDGRRNPIATFTRPATVLEIQHNLVGRIYFRPLQLQNLGYT